MLAALLVAGALSGAPMTHAAAATQPALPPPAPAASSTGGLGAVMDLARDRQKADGDFLSPDDAFRLTVAAAAPDRIRLHWRIADGYYLYKARIKATAGALAPGTLSLPAGETKVDDYFGRQEIYHHELDGVLVVPRGGAGASKIPLTVTYQGCATAGLCYPPITKHFEVALTPGVAGSAADPGAAPGNFGAAPEGSGASGGGGGPTIDGARPDDYVSIQDRFAATIRSGSLLGMLGAFFLAGLGLAFTPCVLPMVPILSGIIAGQGANVTARRGFLLSLTYVLGMSVTYTVAGALFAAAGKQVQSVFQQPWVLLAFAAIFVALALSMFGAFTLQMPAAIQTRLAAASGRQSAGTFGGVAVMGLLSALIVTTCVGPALVGALVVIGQTGQVVRGSAALFAMSLGMGTPLLVVGASAGRLLPRAGAWMETVKRLFGVLMLAVAAWMIDRIVPSRFALLVWAVPALAGAWVMMRGIRTRSWGAWTMRTAGACAGLYAVALLVGAALGGTDPLSPLPQLAAPRHELAFRRIKSLADLDRELARAEAAGHPLLLDFYADWCVSCKEMERYTFSDASVRSALHGAVLLRADVTANDADDRTLLEHFGIFGPPTIAIYGADGAERRNFRVVGYMKPAEFAALVRRATAPSLSASTSAGAT